MPEPGQSGVSKRPPYVGRFAPSPTGPLHAGSLVAALASYLDARAHRGQWLLRMEDLDLPRVAAGAEQMIMQQLAALGMHHDGPVMRQSERSPAYQAAFDDLFSRGLVYPCSCTRREIADSLARNGALRERNQELVYPGTCRHGLAAGRTARAWRLRLDANGPSNCIIWQDRLAGEIREDLAREVGDFVLRRADGLWAYQLAVVVDDAAQQVTDVVRGADLLGSTARQLFLQRLLGYPQPRYLHVPVVTDATGEKLSKQTGAPAIDITCPLVALNAALQHLGIDPLVADSLSVFWTEATLRWGNALIASKV